MTAVVAALLLPLPPIATAKGDHSKGASKGRQAERLRQTEQSAREALAAADVAPSQARPTEEQTFPGLACQIRLVGRGYLSAESIPLVLAGPDDHTDNETKEEVPALQAA